MVQKFMVQKFMVQRSIGSKDQRYRGSRFEGTWIQRFKDIDSYKVSFAQIEIVKLKE